MKAKKIEAYAVQFEGVVYSLKDAEYILENKLVHNVIVNGHIYVETDQFEFEFETSSWSYEYKASVDYYEQVEDSRRYAIDYLKRLEQAADVHKLYVLFTST